MGACRGAVQEDSRHIMNGQAPARTVSARRADVLGEQSWQSLGAWSVPSEPGNERVALARVTAAVTDLDLPPDRLHGLTTAVAEATMNAIEHGNQNRPDVPVAIQVLVCDTALRVRITDQGGGRAIPLVAAPDLMAKLAGRQTPRGWGLFLIRRLVDDLQVSSAAGERTIDLMLYRHDGPIPCGERARQA